MRAERALTSPLQVQMSVAMQFSEASHAVEILRDAGPGGLHIDDLANKIDYIRAGKSGAVRPLNKVWLSGSEQYFLLPHS